MDKLYFTQLVMSKYAEYAAKIRKVVFGKYSSMNKKASDISWDKSYGKHFKLVHTPDGAQTNSSRNTLSIVTPLNGDAWTKWEEAPRHIRKSWRKNWPNIQKTLGEHKNRQIRDSIAGIKQFDTSVHSSKEASTKWIPPKPQHEYGEYFENEHTKKKLNEAGLSFGKKKHLRKFLRSGTPKLLSSLGDIDNVSDDKDFKNQLKDREYKDRYEALKSKKKHHMPIVINIKGKNYLFSGNRRVNLAKENKEDPTVWHINKGTRV